MERSQSRVSATLTVTTGDTNGWARASDDLKTLVEGSLVDLETLYTSTHLDRLASVVLIRPVLELDVLEMMGPKTESTRSSALAVEVVASVTYISISMDPSSNGRRKHTDD